MKAYYYRIYDTKNQDETLIEGILENSEGVIYPAQTDRHLLGKYPKLPFECEAHHFKCEGLSLEGFYFSLERGYCERRF